MNWLNDHKFIGDFSFWSFMHIDDGDDDTKPIWLNDLFRLWHKLLFLCSTDFIVSLSHLKMNTFKDEKVVSICLLSIYFDAKHFVPRISSINKTHRHTTILFRQLFVVWFFMHLRQIEDNLIDLNAKIRTNIVMLCSYECSMHNNVPNYVCAYYDFKNSHFLTVMIVLHW